MIIRKDIAKRVGVSVSVVSRALNNSGYVKDEKRKEILRVANELGYYPNPVAMSLQQRRTKQILYYSKDLNNFFNIELYEGMLAEAERNGYVVLMNGKFDFDIIPRLMIDGIILPNSIITLRYLEETGMNYHLPVVSAAYGEQVSFPKAVPIIESDLYAGMKHALTYIGGKGHENIAMVSPYSFLSSNSRTVAWKDFMKHKLGSSLEEHYFAINKEGLHNDKRVMIFMEESSIDTINIWESYYDKGVLAADIFDERKIKATAVMCFNDEMALGFLNRIRRLGYKIPDELSVMGIDGIPAGRRNSTKLTTLEIQARLMGAECVKELLSIIEGNKEKNIIHIPTRIFEGETVKDINR